MGGLAGSMEMVAFARAILGLGAGFMFAVPLGLFALYVPDDLRPRAFGLNAAMWGVAAIIGPALGAALTGTLGWRWVFWINLPMIAVIAWSARLAMSGHPGARRQPERAAAEPGRAAAARPDRSRRCWRPITGSAPLAIVPAVLFVFHERRTPSPVFTHRRISLAANVAAFAAGAAFLGAEVYLPVQLQVGLRRADLGGRLGAGAGDDRLDDWVDELGPAELRFARPDPDRGTTHRVRSRRWLMALPSAARLLVMAAYGCRRRGHGHRLAGAVHGGPVRPRRRAARARRPRRSRWPARWAPAWARPLAGLVFASRCRQRRCAPRSRPGRTCRRSSPACATRTWRSPRWAAVGVSPAAGCAPSASRWPPSSSARWRRPSASSYLGAGRRAGRGAGRGAGHLRKIDGFVRMACRVARESLRVSVHVAPVARGPRRRRARPRARYRGHARRQPTRSDDRLTRHGPRLLPVVLRCLAQWAGGSDDRRSHRPAAQLVRVRRLPARAARGVRGHAGRPRRARDHAHRLGQVAVLPAAGADRRAADARRLAADRADEGPGRRAARARVRRRRDDRVEHDRRGVARRSSASAAARYGCSTSRPSGSPAVGSWRRSRPPASAGSRSTRRTASRSGATTSARTICGWPTSARGWARRRRSP